MLRAGTSWSRYSGKAGHARGKRRSNEDESAGDGAKDDRQKAASSKRPSLELSRLESEIEALNSGRKN